MIIAISGKKNSGKDTVGKIIQYLTTNFSKELKFKEFTGEDISHEAMMNYIMHTQEISKWKIKKFATIPKQMLCLMLGCTMKDLENREFKEKELGEEWWYIDIYNKKYPYSRKDEFVQGEIEKHLVKPTVRQFMTTLGTDFGRNMIGKNTWVNALFKQYKLEDNRDFLNPDVDGEYPNWIITDLRFPNELEAVKDRKGITIRVNRKVKNWSEAIQYLPSLKHESETALDNAEFDYTIDNDSSIEDLIEKVRLILEQENLL